MASLPLPACVRVCNGRVWTASVVVTRHPADQTLGFGGYSALEREKGKELSFGERSQRAVHCIRALRAVCLITAVASGCSIGHLLQRAGLWLHDSDIHPFIHSRIEQRFVRHLLSIYTFNI